MAQTPQPQRVRPTNIRGRLILEVAAELVGNPDQSYREPDVVLTSREGATVAFSAGSTISSIHDVVSGELDFAFVNPSSALSVAHVGKAGGFTAPQPVRTVTVEPSHDQCLFAVNAKFGITSIEDIAREKLPLRIGLRGRAEHFLNTMVRDLVRAAGFTLEELESWGGSAVREGHIPYADSEKFASVAEGKLDALFDEGVHGWAGEVTPAGMTALTMSDETAANLEAMGYRLAWLTKDAYPTLPHDVRTLDFSGWPSFVHAEAPDDLVTRICAGLEARKDILPWEGDGPLPLEKMCTDWDEAPLGAPLHRAAEKFWAAQGYL